MNTESVCDGVHNDFSEIYIISCNYIIRSRMLVHYPILLKRYGLIYIISAITGNLLCFCLTYLGFYTFYNYLLEKYTITPILLVATLFPLIALFGIRYSPKQWIWKIPFYWGIVHLGVLGEVF